jgi:hypothetical protein
MLCCFPVVAGGMGVMLGGFLMMFGSFFRHTIFSIIGATRVWLQVTMIALVYDVDVNGTSPSGHLPTLSRHF